MEFTVHASDDDGRFSQTFGGDASYEIAPSGALVVTDGQGKRVAYSPAAWLQVEEVGVTHGGTPRSVQ